MGFSGALESARRELFYPRNPRNPRQILYGSGSSGLGNPRFLFQARSPGLGRHQKLEEIEKELGVKFRRVFETEKKLAEF